MATGAEVLNYLCPNVQWSMTNDDFSTIEWINVDKAPITKKQFEDGFAKYNAWKAKQDSDKEATRQTILDRIGLTSDELKTILG